MDQPHHCSRPPVTAISLEDVLDAKNFEPLREARDISTTWIEENNAIRPCDALHGLLPYQYAIYNT
jgi:hypothetical protein